MKNLSWEGESQGLLKDIVRSIVPRMRFMHSPQLGGEGGWGLGASRQAILRSATSIATDRALVPQAVFFGLFMQLSDLSFQVLSPYSLLPLPNYQFGSTCGNNAELLFAKRQKNPPQFVYDGPVSPAWSAFASNTTLVACFQACLQPLEKGSVLHRRLVFTVPDSKHCCSPG